MTGDRLLKITVDKGPLAGREFTLPLRAAITIGRQDDASIHLDGDDFVSLRHAEIVHTPAGILLRNRSANGTLVNGRPVTETLINVGDRISIGLMHLLTVKGIPAPLEVESRPSPPKADGKLGEVASAPVRRLPKIPMWLMVYLSLMVTVAIFFGAMKLRAARAAGFPQVRAQEETYATARQWSTEETNRVLQLLESALVFERRGDQRSAYEAYREALGVRRPIDPRSPAYQFAAARMAELGAGEPRRR